MGIVADKMKGKNRQIILRSIDFIKVYRKNTSSHSQAQIAQNMAFLGVFLCPKPLLISPKTGVTAGYTWLETNGPAEA